MYSLLAKSVRLLEANGPVHDLQPACACAGFWMQATLQRPACHASWEGFSDAQPLSTSLFTSGENVILCSQEVNALLRRTVRFQPLLPFDRDRPGRRQPLNLRGPLDGKPRVADLEDDPMADCIVGCGRYRKLVDALHRIRFSLRRSAISAWPPFLACDRHRYQAGILAFSYSRHPSSLDRVRTVPQVR